MASMSTYYVSHGTPNLPLEKEPAKAFLEELGKTFVEKPKAILMISGHWDTREPMVSTMQKNETVYDFWGFPPETYQLSYTPPGAPAVGRRVKQLLMEAGFQCGEDSRRGLDHGAWAPLMLVFPEADVPVLQLSVQSHRNAAHHYKIGQALQCLKDEGVMIMGSGSALHNLPEVLKNFNPNYDDGIMVQPADVKPWAKAFDDWIHDSLINDRFDDLAHYETRAPYAKKAHPHNDHYVPLLVALGAAGQGAKAELLHNSWPHATLSMAAYRMRSAALVAKESSLLQTQNALRISPSRRVVA